MTATAMNMPACVAPPATEDAIEASSILGGLLALLVLMALTLLAGCGGADGDAQAPPPSARLPELSGRVTDGASATDVGALQITVKGNVGTARTAEGRLTTTDGSDYLASLDQLSPPYLLSDSSRSPSSLSLYSVATGPGIANLTPLTTLLVAQLLAAEPGAYYEALGARGGFTAADEASIAIAEQRVRRYLQREFGFELPAAIGDFVTTPFARTPGDPMFDTVTALVERIGTAGDYGAVVQDIAQEAARCRVEQVAVTAGALSDDFCPFGKTNEADPDDPTVQVLGFTNRRGDSLTLRLRGAVVLGADLRTAEGVASDCSGPACTGIEVGTPAGDRTQSLRFVNARLGGPAGERSLSGELRTAVPGVPLPGLPCTTNRFYLVDQAAGSAQGYCATPDDFGLGAAGQSFRSGATRRSFSFNDGAGGPYLEVVTQGGAVVRALVYTIDPDSGATTPRFQCRDGGCAGATLSTVTVDESLGLPVVLQPIGFDDVVMAAVLPDGSLSATESVSLQATLIGYFVDDPNALPFVPVACAATAATVAALPSDQALPITVCEPDDPQGFQLRSTSIDAEGNTVFNLGGLLTDNAGSFTVGNGITVTVTPSGAVASVSFDAFDGPRYRCLAAACNGVSISAPNGLGERTITLQALLLRELGSAGLDADRSAVLDGSILGPPVP